MEQIVSIRAVCHTAGYSVTAGKTPDGSYFFQNEHTDIPNEFGKYCPGICEFAMETLIRFYHGLMDEKPSPFADSMERWTFVLTYDDGSTQTDYHLLRRASALKLRSIRSYNEFLRLPMAQNRLGSGRIVLPLQSPGNADLAYMRKICAEGTVPFSDLYRDIFNQLFYLSLGHYELSVIVDEDRALRAVVHSERNHYLSEATFDTVGFVQKTLNHPMLECFREQDVRMVHDFLPGTYSMDEIRDFLK